MADLRVSLKLTADAEGLIGEVKRSQVEVGKFTEAASTASSSLARMDALAGDVRQSLGNAAGGAAGLTAAVTSAAGANDNLAGKTRLSTQQIQALGYTASDVAASLASGASPFTILLQQGGQVLQAFPAVAGRILGVGAAAAAIIAPIAMVSARIASIAGETRELSTILRAMGSDAAVSAGQLRTMTEEAAKIGGSRADAYEAALSLARNPKIQDGELFRDILKLAPDVAAVLGVAIPSAAEKLGEALGAGAEGVKRLDDELAFLSVEQQRQVQTMALFGDRAGALNVAIRALQDRYGGAAHTMRSEWGNALHDASRAWDAYIERLANSDIAGIVARKVSEAAKGLRSALEQDRASELRGELARIDREYSQLPEKTSGVPATHEALLKRRIELQRQLNELQASESGLAGNNGSSPSKTDSLRELSKALSNVMALMDLAPSKCEFPADAISYDEMAAIFNEAMK